MKKMTQMLPRTTKSHSIERQENWAKERKLSRAIL